MLLQIFLRQSSENGYVYGPQLADRFMIAMQDPTAPRVLPAASWPLLWDGEWPDPQVLERTVRMEGRGRLLPLVRFSTCFLPVRRSANDSQFSALPSEISRPSPAGGSEHCHPAARGPVAPPLTALCPSGPVLRERRGSFVGREGASGRSAYRLGEHRLPLLLLSRDPHRVCDAKHPPSHTLGKMEAALSRASLNGGPRSGAAAPSPQQQQQPQQYSRVRPHPSIHKLQQESASLGGRRSAGDAAEEREGIIASLYSSGTRLHQLYPIPSQQAQVIAPAATTAAKA